MNQIAPTLLTVDPALDVWGKPLNAILRLIIDQGNASDEALLSKTSLSSPAFTGSPTAPTPNVGSNSNTIATTAFVTAAVAALVGASPAQLDTLNELAAALANDPNFASSINTTLASKITAPAGGSTGQVLTKTATGYGWASPTGGGSSGSGLVTDNGDGTFELSGTSVTDNGDGTFTV